MQRIRVPGGVLSTVQWREIAQLAAEYTPRTPLHLTTRQDLELHDLTAEQIPLVQERLARVGLTTLGAGGDSVRNITVCPCAGVLSGTLDLTDLAEKIQNALNHLPGIWDLPRKFKISLSACEKACGQPWLNDLGLSARLQNDNWGFQVVAGGSLGPRPLTAMRIFEWIPATEVMPLTVAAAQLFMEHGDRQQRHKARLRHVRERWGDAEFAQRLLDQFAKVRQEQKWPPIELKANQSSFAEKIALNFLNGDLSPAAAEALAELAGRQDVRVKLGNQHQVLIFGKSKERLRELLGTPAALRGAFRAQIGMVACPGARWCKRALTDTAALARDLQAALQGRMLQENTICISGCPNNCAQSNVAEIGLVGGITMKNGKKEEQYTLYQNGGQGRDPRLAEATASNLDPKAVPETILEILMSMKAISTSCYP